MKSSSVYKSVMQEYERDRLNAEQLIKMRRDELYLAIPRIKEIDSELTLLGINISKKILSGGGNEILISELRHENETLMQEKYKLMKEHGFKDDYLKDIYKCAVCKDTGFKGNARCNCLTRRLINKYYELSNLSAVLERENFDTFDLNYYSEKTDDKIGVSPRMHMKKTYMACLNFVKYFDSEFQNLLLYGSTALGKTFMCNCIAKELLDNGKSVIYFTASQLFRMVEELRFNRNEEDNPDQYADMVFGSELLIIDDLGTELSTAVTTSELFNIINTRYLERKPVIISTNLSPRDFEKQYSDRITSRLLGNYTLLKFSGEDIRLKKKYGM